MRNVGIPPKFYLPGICLGGSQSAVAARFLGVVPYGVGLSSQIEVRKLVLNPEFEKSKRSLAEFEPARDLSGNN